MSAERELGEHSKAIETLEKDVAQIKDDLSEIKTLLAGARGGWKVLVAASGLAAAAGAGLLKLAEMFGKLLSGPVG